MLENTDIVAMADKHGSWAMSDFQSRYFVVNSQVTDYRRVRQALLEIETRIGGRKQIERNMRRTNLELKLKLEEYDNESHPLKKELILVDIDQLNYDMSVYEKKLRIVKEEIDNFCEIVKSLVPDMQSLEGYKEQNLELERDYWITRMAKQAAMDLMTIGRVSQGNMDSIAMMPLSDQEATIKTAITYTASLNKAIGSVEEQVKLEMKRNQDLGFQYIAQDTNSNPLLDNKVSSEEL
jgi:hypothetical protein